MDEHEGLRQLQRLLAQALRRGELEALTRGAAALPEDLRAAVAHVDPDGLRIAALLVAKLRFERLMQGSRVARAWQERDPAGFAVAFRIYHRDVRPTALEPRGEAEGFERWAEGAPWA